MQKPKSFRPWQPDQTTLLPPSPREWLAEDCPASTPLAEWRQSSWPVRAADRPQVVVDDNLGATVAEATRKLSHPSVRAIASTGFL